MKHDEFDPFPTDEYMARLVEQITKGPWHAEEVIGSGPVDIVGPDVPGHGSPRVVASAFYDESGEDWDLPIETAIANAAFIASCRNYVPWSLFAISACREFIEGILSGKSAVNYGETRQEARKLLNRISAAKGFRP